MPANGEGSFTNASQRAWLSAGAPIFGLVVLIILAACWVYLDAAQQQNRSWRQSNIRLVENTINGRGRALADMTRDFASWNDAYQAVSVRWDPEWVSNNYYSSVTDGLIVVRADGSVRYAWLSEPLRVGGARLIASVTSAALRVPGVDALMRAPNPADTVTRARIEIDGRLAIVAIAPISPEESASRIRVASTGAPVDYLIGVQLLSPAEITEMGDALALRDFTYHTADAPPEGVALTLTGARGGALGHLQWRDERPGDHALAARLAPAVLGLLLIGVLTMLIAGKLVQRQIETAARAEAASESSRLKSEFIASMSHELRTPLEAIVGYAQLIQEEGAHDAAYDAVRSDAERILSAARQLSRLVNDVLDQSRIDAGYLKLRPEQVRVDDLLAEVNTLLAPLARSKGLRFDVATQAGGVLFCDHQRTLQCLLNLVGNAIKFTDAGSVTVTTRLATRGNGQHLTFDVTDTGVGIARDDYDRLFKPFAQGGDKQRQASGAGLGLSIAHKLARAMGGDIVFVSEPGQGSCFSFSLPISGQAALHGRMAA